MTPAFETAFQFRATSAEPLRAVAVTIPVWPGLAWPGLAWSGEGEAVLLAGPSRPTIEPGPH